MKKYLVLLAAILISTTAQAAKLNFEKADKNKDGVLSKEEFVAEHKIINPKVKEKMILRWFNKNDKNQDGEITPDEFKKKE